MSQRQFGVAIEPIAEEKIGRVVFAGLVAARVNIQEASHQYADVADSGGSILESKPSGSAQILWRRNATQQGEQWAVVRLGNVDSIPLVRFQLTESLSEFGSAAATITSSGPSNGTAITVSDWAGNYAESGDKGIAWQSGNNYYVIEIKAIASDSPGAPVSIVRFTLTDNISLSSNTAPATIVSSGSDNGTAITVNDWCRSGGMAGDRGIAWKVSGNVYYILELTKPRQFLTARISSAFEFTDACPDGPYDLTGIVGVDREWDNSQAAPKAHNPLKIKVWNDCKVKLQFNAVENRWEIIAATSDKLVHGIEIYKSPSAAPECKLRELQFDGWQNWGDPNWVTEVIVSGTAPNQALRYKTFCTPAASSGALIVEIRNTCP
ncbi:MAG: hypothetical protein NTW52_08280 [Planctomycetota bacterium]|nr:hypothetical protein [Planctomycetota bacterium]